MHLRDLANSYTLNFMGNSKDYDSIVCVPFSLLNSLIMFYYVNYTLMETVYLMLVYYHSLGYLYCRHSLWPTIGEWFNV